MTSADRASIERLTAINVEDFLDALGVSRGSMARPLLAALCRPLARRFAGDVLTYDAVVGEKGLAAGGEWASRAYVKGWAVSGAEKVPREGPLLAVSNHPGLYDAVLIFASLGRDDLKVIAAERPFLRALPNTSPHLFYVGDTASRLSVLRSAAQHLRDGGSLLTFPGGEIEPDPSLCRDASSALDLWTPSVTIFLRLVPGLAVVPTAVSGVHSPVAQRHPLTRIRRRRRDREWLGAMLQVVFPSLARVRPRVAFGEPVRVPGCEGPGRAQAASAWAETVQRARALIQAVSREGAVEAASQPWLDHG